MCVPRVFSGLLCVCPFAMAWAAPSPQQPDFAARVWVENQRHSVNDTDYNVGAGGVTGGYTLAPGVMVEGSVGTGLSDDTQGDITLVLNRSMSLSLRMTAPPSPSGYRLLSRVGLSVVSLQQRNDATTEEDFSGGHFSLGVEREWLPKWTWTLEAVYIALDDNIDSGAIRASLSWELQR